MHVLVTADSLSSSWTYTRELVTGLVTRGARVTLVSFGEIPLPEQTTWMDHLHGLEYRPTAFHLEWMQDAETDFADSSAYLMALIHELRPDVLHLNQFCYGNLPVDVPRVVMAHGDLVTWSQAVHSHASRDERSLRWYRKTVLNGLAGADALVAPLMWMLERISACYERPRRGEVIYPGRNPIFFNPYVNKDDSVLAVGRMVDASKQVFLLTQQPHSVPVCIVGAEHTVPMPRIPIRADVKVATEQTSVAIRGHRPRRNCAPCIAARRSTQPLRGMNPSAYRPWRLLSHDARLSPTIFPAFAKSGETPLSIFVPTIRRALPKNSLAQRRSRHAPGLC